MWTVVAIGFVLLQAAYQYAQQKYWADKERLPTGDDIEVPNNRGGAAIPLVYGRQLVRSPVVLWTGNKEAITFQEDGINKTSFIASVQYGVCLSNVDVTTEASAPARLMIDGLWVDDFRPALWPRLTDVESAANIEVRKVPETTWPGLNAVLEFSNGAWNSTVGELITAAMDRDDQDTTLIPPYRGIVTALLTGDRTYIAAGGLDSSVGGAGYFGALWAYKTPVKAITLPPVAFEVINPVGIPGVDALLMEIGDGDCNPAGVLYDLLVNTTGGRLGVDPSLVDVDSFEEAALVLHAEENGFSYVEYNPKEVQKIIEIVCKQIEGVLYEDPGTLKWTLRLMRETDVATPEDLPLFDNDSIVEVVSLVQGTWAGAPNSVTLNYRARHTNIYGVSGTITIERAYADASFTLHNQSAASTAGKTNALLIDMPGVSNDGLAGKLTARLLRASSVPLVRGTFVVNRDAFFLYPGQAFRVQHPDFDNQVYVMRVTKINLGSFEATEITIDCVQDRFSIAYSVSPTPPRHVEPGDTIAPAANVTTWAGEAPRWILNRIRTQGRYIDPDSALMMYIAEQPGFNDGFRGAYSNNGDATILEDTGTLLYPLTARVAATYSRTLDPYDTTTGLLMGSFVGGTPSAIVSTVADDIRVKGKNLIAVGATFETAEIMSFEVLSDQGGGEWLAENVWRGLLDTVPADHAIDEYVWVLDPTFLIVGEPWRWAGRYGFDYLELVRLRVLGVVGSNVEGSRTAVYDDVTVGWRTLRPYPPANMRIENSKVPAAVKFEGVDIEWTRRSRTKAFISRGDAGDETPPDANTAYAIVAVKGDDEVTVTTSITGQASLDQALAVAGYGQQTVLVRAGYPLTLGSGINTHTAWQDPGLPLFLYEWRNLLRTADFAGPAATQGQWVIVSGDPSWSNSNVGPFDGTVGASRVSYFPIGGGVSEVCEIRQTVTVTGYKPKRMRCELDFYTRSLDADDLLTVTLKTLDADNATQDTQTYGPSAPSTSQWDRQTLTISSADVDTDRIRIDLKLDAEGEIDSTPGASASALRLRLGQFTAQLLSNESFESGTTSWTTTAGGFTTPSGNALEGAQKLQGVDNATNTIYQEVSVTAGFNYGYAVLDVGYREPGPSLNCSATITVEARASAGGTVLATANSGALTPEASAGWYRAVVACDVPAGATIIRVTLSSARNSGTSNDLEFDEALLYLHKYLDPQTERELVLRPSGFLVLPRSQYEWRRTFPDVPAPDYGIFDGSLSNGLSGQPEMEAVGAAFVDCLFTGAFEESGFVQHPAYEVRREGGVIRSRTNNRYANFDSATPFTVRVVFDPRDTAWGPAGLAGRLASLGWALELNASGYAQARLVGLDGTKSVTRSTALHTGGPTWAAIAYDPAADLLWVMDPAGSSSVSTASGLGEFANTDIIRFCLGAVSESGTSMTGLVGSCEIWQQCLTYAQLASTWVYGGDEGLDNYALSARGVQSGRQVAFVCAQDLTGSPAVTWGGAGTLPHVWDMDAQRWGLGSASARANLAAVSANTTTGWTTSGATVTLDAVLGPDGARSGVLLRGTNAQYRSLDFNPGAGPINVMFFARKSLLADTASTIYLELRNSSGTLVQSTNYSLNSEWTAIRHTFSGWDNSTDLASIRLYASNTGTTLSMYIAGPVFVDQNTDAPFPTLFHISGTDASTYTSIEGFLDDLDTSPALQFNHEGEVVAEVSALNENMVDGTVFDMQNNTNNNDRRRLRAASSTAAFAHYDGSASNTESETSALDWRGVRELRCRWNRAGLLDGSSVFAGIIATEGSDYDRTAIWTPGTATLDAFHIGHAAGSDLFDGVVYSLIVRTREKIL